jgi:16S rRNA (cytosine1407-C5)-methyltransferase
MNKPWEVLPPSFREKITKIIPSQKQTAVLASFCTKKPSTFRANKLKITATLLQKELEKLGITTQTVPWYQDAFILQNVLQKVLTETEFYKNGYLYLQNLSSMIPPLVLDPKPHESILDITAAPGSKTTQMAAMMQNTGKIIANDKSRIRLYKLEANLKLQGVTNTEITYLPGQMLWKKYPEYFDKTLVDVPCSLEGTFQCDNPKTFKDWSPKKSKLLVQTQRYLLRSAISATKVGGTIVYSTCTLAPEENEGIIDWILKTEKNALQVEAISPLLKKEIGEESQMAGLTSWNTKTFNHDLRHTLRILPTNTMEGFYVAKLKKVKTTLPEQ